MPRAVLSPHLHEHEAVYIYDKYCVPIGGLGSGCYRSGIRLITAEATIQHLLVRDTCFVTSTTKKAPRIIGELLEGTVREEVTSMR